MKSGQTAGVMKLKMCAFGQLGDSHQEIDGFPDYTHDATAAARRFITISMRICLSLLIYCSALFAL